MMKKILIALFVILLSGSGLFAQEEENNKANVIFGTDITSRYVWRGLELGASPAIQPYFFWNKGNFSIGTWSSYALNEHFIETDLMVSYNTKFFSVMLVDFFFPLEGFGVSNNYFNYKKEETGHAYELSLTLSPFENFPISLMGGTIFYGADLDAELNNRYSTYMELAYPFTYSNVDFNLFLGGVLNDKENIYADGAGIINLGFKASKKIQLNENHSFSSYFSFITNPKAENVHFLIGLNF